MPEILATATAVLVPITIWEGLNSDSVNRSKWLIASALLAFATVGLVLWMISSSQARPP
jgi:hypothetical protein